MAIDYERAFGQLCHLAALNSTAKVRGAVESLTVTTLTLDPTRHKTAETIGAAMFVLFGTQPPSDALAAAVDSLVDSGRLRRSPDGSLQPSEAERAAVEERARNARSLEVNVRHEWIQQLALEAPHDLVLQDALWTCLTRYLALAFRRHGAETVALLDPSGDASAGNGPLTGYLDTAITEAGLTAHRSLAEAAVNSFLSSATEARAAYVAQLLDGTLTFYAVSLDEATTEFLSQTLDPLNILLDTNYIFGLLDLHDNFFVQASKELVRFVQDNGLPFRFYYHEYTLAEIQRTLQAQSMALRSRRWSVALSRAAIQADATYGLERLYHKLNQEGPVDVEAFLSRFENPDLLLRPLGLSIYREGAGVPFTLDEKGRLIAEYADFLKGHVRRERAYEAMDHDMAVLLALRRQIAPGRSVLRAGAVFLTNDYWLFRFTQDLKPTPSLRPRGMVALPTQFLQLLRPFVPATDDFDRRFVASFALPEFRTVQSGYSETSRRVLSYLATYRDLPTETAVALLRDHALASRLRSVNPESDEYGQLIESEVVKRNQLLLEEKVALESELEAARADIARFSTAQSAAVSPPSVDEESSSASEALTRAETAEAKYQRLVRSVRVTVGLLLFLVALCVIWAGPSLIGWQFLEEHPHSLGIRVAASVAAAALCLAVGIRANRETIGTTLVASFLAVSQVL